MKVWILLSVLIIALTTSFMLENPKAETIYVTKLESNIDYDVEYELKAYVYRQFQDSVLMPIQDMIRRETGDSTFSIKTVLTSKCRKGDKWSHHYWKLFPDSTWRCAVDLKMSKSPLPISDRYVMEFVKHYLEIDQTIFYLAHHLHLGYWMCNNRNEFMEGIIHWNWTEYKPFY